MYRVMLCGATDCFTHAFFVDYGAALGWAEKNSKNPEGYIIKYEEELEKLWNND